MNEKKKPRNESSYALITGASSGMGKEYAIQLYSYGYNLIIISRIAVDIEKTRREILAMGFTERDIVAIALDLSKVESASVLYEKIRDKQVDILINNAGIFDYADYIRIPLERSQEMLVLHNYTPVTLCRLIGSDMSMRGYGKIMNISSLTAWMPYPGIALYAASKRFNKSFSRSLRIEFKGSGVSVTTAYFGAVSTNLFRLDDRHRRLAIKMRIMMTPQNASHKALKAMFSGRANVMPGVINKISLPFIVSMPAFLLHFMDKKIGDGYKFY